MPLPPAPRRETPWSASPAARIDTLTRDELQGVIAHEFSHILNGDMRLNIRLIGIVNGILLIAMIGYILMRTGGVERIFPTSSDKKGGNPLPLLGLLLYVIGYIGVFFGNLIKSAVSRQREFLADASAVQFTRIPGGIAGALKKIGGLAERLASLQTPHAEEASHMFFGNGVAQAVLQLAGHAPAAGRAHPPHRAGLRRQVSGDAAGCPHRGRTARLANAGPPTRGARRRPQRSSGRGGRFRAGRRWRRWPASASRRRSTWTMPKNCSAHCRRSYRNG